jgi:hypothetical protein
MAMIDKCNAFLRQRIDESFAFDDIGKLLEGLFPGIR